MAPCASAICAVVLSLMAATAVGKGKESDLPKKFQKSPYSLMSLSIGYPNAGWQLRPIKLKAKKYLRIKKGSDKRVYGHPALVKMLYRNARDMSRTFRGSVMLVGDISDEDGGPLSGHHSHQSGRDADVAFFALDAKGKPVQLDRFVAFKGDGKAKDGSGYTFDDQRNWLLVQNWIKDHRAGLSHIFVSRPLRKRLLAYAGKHGEHKKYVKQAMVLMKEPKNADAHDDHFHLRISCPKKQDEICHEEPRR